MSMLTGEYEPTSGSAWLNGFDVVTQQEQVRQELGFCPQFDPLLGLLTAREHLVMYGRIRGIAEERLHPLVQNLIVKLGLAPFADNISETYSGGNKRKLSLALALIGEPSVVFLSVQFFFSSSFHFFATSPHARLCLRAISRLGALRRRCRLCLVLIISCPRFSFAVRSLLCVCVSSFL